MSEEKEPRFDLLPITFDDVVIDVKKSADEGKLVGIIDEQAGGIIGYAIGDEHAELFLEAMANQHDGPDTDIVFDGPPGNESGRFVEVEDENGKSISAGKWLLREDNVWVLRLQGVKR